MNKFKKMEQELNRKNKEIERLNARDGVKFSKRLEKKIKELEANIEHKRDIIGDWKKNLAKCLKEKEKLKNVKK